MKTHKIRHGGDFTEWGWDNSFRTYCGITEGCGEDVKFVDRRDECTCKKCKRGYEVEMEKYVR